MGHAWCRDEARDAAVRAAEDAADAKRPTLPDHRDLPAAVEHLRSIVHAHLADSGELIGVVQRINARVERLEGMIPKSGSATSAPDHENKGESMGTKADRQAADYRAEASERAALRAERITQSLTADRFASAVREADTLRARVEELESQLESVADRAAAAETALEAAQAASGGGGSDARTREISDGILSLEHMLHLFRDDQRPTVQARLEKMRRLVEVLRDHPQAASGGGEVEPVAWGVVARQTNEVPPGCASPRRVSKKPFARFATVAEAQQFAMKTKGTLVPIYAPPQPRGWMTEEERDAILFLIVGSRSQFSPQTPHEARRNAACRVCHSLLDRSTPPEVVLPAVATWGMDGHAMLRRAEVQSALAAAGVAVKEVGR
jgi:hypothetical protein